MERIVSADRILIVDDDPQASKAWKQALEALGPIKNSFEIESVPEDQFKQAMEGLEARRRVLRDPAASTQPFAETRLAEAAILIVDYDLIGLTREDYLTGEAVAY